MPRFSISSPSPRVSRREQRQQNELLMQQNDMAEQNAMLQQLATIYGISKEEDFAPAKLAAIEAQTRATNAEAAAREFENQWAQPNAEMAYNLHGAQADALRERGDKPDRPLTLDEAVFMGMTPEEYALVRMPAQVKQARDAAAAKKEQERQAAIALDKQHQTTASKVESPYANPGAAELSGKIGDSIMDMPYSIYNAAGGLSDFITSLVGIPVRSARAHPYSKQMAAHRAGRQYAGTFYDPKDNAQQYPLPVAKERR